MTNEELMEEIAEGYKRVESGEIDGCMFIPSGKDPNGITIEIKSNRLEPVRIPKKVKLNWML